jgi:hypothetical protein
MKRFSMLFAAVLVVALGASAFAQSEKGGYSPPTWSQNTSVSNSAGYGSVGYNEYSDHTQVWLNASTNSRVVNINSSMNMWGLNGGKGFGFADPSEFDFNVNIRTVAAITPDGSVQNRSFGAGTYTAGQGLSISGGAQDDFWADYDKYGNVIGGSYHTGVYAGVYCNEKFTVSGISANYNEYFDEYLGQTFGEWSLSGHGSFGPGELGDAKGIAVMSTMNSVPEPASLGLLSVSGIALLRRRRHA